ncbi:hypothetical protein L1275_001416 [Flavobacterium sp. HSC-61S13]|nr:hypothetical protein [Flavobacterium sp. HSC-61S13]
MRPIRLLILFEVNEHSRNNSLKNHSLSLELQKTGNQTQFVRIYYYNYLITKIYSPLKATSNGRFYRYIMD